MLTLLHWYWHRYWYWNRYRQRQWQLQRLDKHQGTVKEWKLTLISTPNPCNLLSKSKRLLFTTARSCRQTPEIWRRLPRRKRRRPGWCQSVSWNITKDLVLQELKDTESLYRPLLANVLFTDPVPSTDQYGPILNQYKQVQKLFFIAKSRISGKLCRTISMSHAECTWSS